MAQLTVAVFGTDLQENGDGSRLNLGGAGVVKFEELILFLGVSDAHRSSWVLVQYAGDDVGDEGAPLLGSPERHEVILQQLENGAQVELGVFQKAK